MRLALPTIASRVLLAWILVGLAPTLKAASGGTWWAFNPVQNPPLPRIRNGDWPRNAIDTFILAKLEQAQLPPSPAASARALLRRLYFDVTGLPPSPEQVERFVTDPSGFHYTKIVDELLASPAYGERWGRHWLDVARFGESDGFERNNTRETLWPYRDWVIEALNRDLPYDEFARQQLAGDLLTPHKTLEALAPVGFLVAGVHNTVVGASEFMKKTARQDELEEIAAAVGPTFLGLTVQCARCHDHKYDPIPSVDYYRFISALSGIQHGEEEYQDASGKTGRGKIYTVSKPRAEIIETLARGDVRQPAGRVSPGGLSAIAAVNPDFGLPPDAPDQERRRRLAGWITDAKNPLFARVMVNRLWHYHFGRGLVETPNDFGVNGGRPSHPELLDWLATEFVARGYGMKAMHRLIVHSNTYRQSSAPRADGLAQDADNRWLWRQAPIRLDAESLRDALLCVAGQLRHVGGGPGFKDVQVIYLNGTTYFVPLETVEAATCRRTVYRFSPRGGRSALLDTFDCPDPSAATPRRSSTTTPLQALALWNSTLVLQMCDRLTERVQKEAGADVSAQLDGIYQLVYGRSPSEEERKACLEFVPEHGLAALGRVLVNGNEFVLLP